MGAMKKMALFEYADVKIEIANNMIILFNEYLTGDGKLVGLANKVIRVEVTIDHALNLIDEVIKKITELTEYAITFYSKEPGENPYLGLLTLFSNNTFNNAVDAVEFDACMAEPGEQRLEVVLRVNNNREDR